MSRRSFLKLSAAVGAGLGWASLAQASEAPRRAAVLPLPGAEHMAELEAGLARPPAGFDLLLIPAYVAATYIRGGFLQTLAGPRGRPHDPDGTFTWPHSYQVGVVLEHEPGRSASWATAWQGAAGRPWPAPARLVIGVALLRRGYSPNDLHPGHLAQVEADLLARAPHLAGSGLGMTPELAFGWVDLSTASAGELPQEGAPMRELDWVIPAGAPDPAAARAYLEAQAPAAPPPGSTSARLIPLMPLTVRAAEQHAALWRRLAGPRRSRLSATGPDFF